ncbi:MAG: VIT domain-containing protein [Desulfobacterales bacterium]
MAIRSGSALAVVMVLNLLAALLCFAGPAEFGDKTLSPYFWVKSDHSELETLPLKSTKVQADISGVIADVAITQVYENTGQVPLEAVYVFPASTKAAVYGMKMRIGERTVHAKIAKRNEARKAYDAAKQTGRSASLLEQHRPNVFQMNVANILPGDVVTVELRFTELLIPTNAVYEFVFPTVVGPRYTGSGGEAAGGAGTWAANPYLHQGDSAKTTLDISVNLHAGLPIGDVFCNTHAVTIGFSGPDTANIDLEDSDRYGGNRDFILKYRLAGKRIQTGLLVAESDNENFFLLMLQPPKRVKTDRIPPREYLFIMDISGSMHGFPLEISKNLLKDVIEHLRPIDRFNVLLFAGSSRMLSDTSLPAAPENIERAVDLIENQRGGGSTELLPALKKALDIKRTEGFSRTVVIATDGYVTVEAETFDLIRRRLGDANLFAFGIGASVNRHLIEGMARAGMGEPFVVTAPETAHKKAEAFRKMIETPVLTDIRVDWGDFDVYDIEPPSVPDVMARRPVIIFGKWRGNPAGTIRITGKTGKGVFSHNVNVKHYQTAGPHTALRHLWARHRAAVLSDYNRLTPDETRVHAITEMGLTYGLLTAYTSFVAVDTEVRRQNGSPVTIAQPLPLPQGVSDYAVGGNGFARLQTAPEARGKSSRRLHREEAGCMAYDKAVESETTKRIHIVRITATGGVPEDGIRKVLQNRMREFETCHDAWPVTLSRITIELELNSEGRVTGIDIDRKTAQYPSLMNCLQNALKNLAFPAPASGNPEKITILLARRH